ncbi:hypothetical protein MK139_05585 [bacterium]|jgi:hypothetical protein|nr:hypothetical protein [bacterium]
MLSPISGSNVRVEDRDRRKQSGQRRQKRRKENPVVHIHEKDRGDKIDLTA